MHNTILSILIAFFAHNLHASIVVTTDDRGRQQVEIFDSGTLTSLEDGQLSFIYDKGDCQFFDHQQRVSVRDKCAELPKKFAAASEKMMAAMGITKEQLAAMRNMQGGASEFKLEKAGSSTVAGYKVECYKGSATNEICLSKKLLDEIAKEVDVAEIEAAFSGFANPMGDNPEFAARQELSRQGFIMKDVDLEMPNSGLMSFLPADQLEKLMQEFLDSGAEPEGEVVVSVERDVQVDYRVPDYRKVSVEEYFQMMMADQ
ncbi:MAG: hypothetical protein AAF434_17835 [Pseudomonadota bacterium]